MSTTEQTMNALGDRTRWAIFDQLARGGPCSVGELAKGLPVGRPAVSMQLRVLRDAGLVSERPQGNRRIYSVNPDGLAALRNYFAAVDQAIADRLREHP
jgi:DNA-binding transcriptional ArsR family regulator